MAAEEHLSDVVLVCKTAVKSQLELRFEGHRFAATLYVIVALGSVAAAVLNALFSAV